MFRLYYKSKLFVLELFILGPWKWVVGKYAKIHRCELAELTKTVKNPNSKWHFVMIVINPIRFFQSKPGKHKKTKESETHHPKKNICAICFKLKKVINHCKKYNLLSIYKKFIFILPFKYFLMWFLKIARGTKNNKFSFLAKAKKCWHISRIVFRWFHKFDESRISPATLKVWDSRLQPKLPMG